MWEKREIVYVLLIILMAVSIATMGIVGSAKVEMLENENTYLNNELNKERWENSSERLFPN